MAARRRYVWDVSVNGEEEVLLSTHELHRRLPELLRRVRDHRPSGSLVVLFKEEEAY